MKKLLILFVLLSVVVSCNKAPEQIVIKTMAYGDNSNAEGINWKRLVDEFEAVNPNIKIDYELLYDQAYHQKVVARLASGDIPHLAYMGADARWGAPWREASQQWDHRPFLDLNYYDLKLIPQMGPNGEIWEVPLGTSNITTVLFMNKNLVESLGFSEPRTYADLVAMVPAARAAGLEVVTFDGADGWAWGSCMMSALIARTSGDPNWVSKAVAGQNKFTDKAFIDALNLVSQMISDGVLSEKTVNVDYGTNTSNFNNGKALFMIQGQWVAGSIENKEVADNMVLLPFPAFPGESPSVSRSVAAAISVGYGLTKEGASDEKRRDAALKFLQYFNSAGEVEQRLRDGAIVAPILKNFKIPSDLPNSTKQKVVLANNSIETEVIDAFLSGTPNDLLNAGLQELASKQASAEEVAQKIEAAMKR